MISENVNTTQTGQKECTVLVAVENNLSHEIPGFYIL